MKKEKLTEEWLEKQLERSEGELERKRKLFDVYMGRDMPSKGRVAEGRPDNRAYTNFAKYITDTASGYFAGIAPKYVFDDANESEIFKKVFDENDETTLNYTLAEYMSICGTAYDVVFTDEDSKLKIAVMDPREVTPIYRETLGGGMEMAVRQFHRYDGYELKRMGELYTADEKILFEYKNGKLRFTSREKNYIGILPVTEYRNNCFMTGDFEACLDNIALYNLLLSNTSDDLQSIANAYLAISGMLGTTQEDIRSMNETRIALLADGGKMEFITKNLDASAVENHKRSLRQDILQVAGIPDLTDEKLISGLSGTAMEYRLWALDQLRAKKQAGMDKGLFGRLKVIAAFLNLRFANIENIEKRTTILYTRNIPQDISGCVENAVKLKDSVSKKTLFTVIEPFTKVSPEDEGKRLMAEAADCGTNKSDRLKA